MTPDPRTEEIRTRLAALHHDEAEFGGATAEDRFTRAAVGRMFDSDAPADLAYLLGRIEALESGREVEQTMLRNGATLMTDMADYQSRLRAERDRYRAVADAARSVDTLLPGPDRIDVKHRAQLASAMTRLTVALTALDGGVGE